ncbi:MAG TPA: TetR family transcriptional regulator [Gemmatimonadaceae bacterium]|nr:TetR family transcriptional regulator [Gemmatimonadaceae bacterium]
MSTPRRSATAPPDDMRDRILTAAESVLRRHGAAKLTVMDVARTLGMSHANIYRYFPSKTALQDALVERWLQQVVVPLREIAVRPDTASERLEAWLLALIAVKRRKVLNDPELFEAYHAAAEAAHGVVNEYHREVKRLLTRIVRDGVAAGEFPVRDVDAAVSAIRDATTRFVDPHHIRRTAGKSARSCERDARRVLAMLIAGLRSGAL